MRAVLRFALALGILLAAVEQRAHAQDNTIYVATYIELMPSAAASGAALLRRYRQASRKEQGNLRFDVLAEIARNSRFVIIEAWSDKGVLDAHSRSASSAQFVENLKAIQDAPEDQRIGHALYLERGANAQRPGAIYAVTHIDVIPPGTDGCIAALRAMSVDTPKDAGNISYDVLEQANHANHFTVVEEWTGRQAADAHAMAAHTRAFREKLKPIAGALYDERFYNALN